MLLCARYKSMLNAPCLYGGLQSDCGMDDCAESMCPMEVVPAMTLLLLSTRVISLFDSIEEGFVGGGVPTFFHAKALMPAPSRAKLNDRLKN